MQVRCMAAGRPQPLTTTHNIGRWLSSGHTIQEKGRAGERAQERSHSPFITNLRKEPMVAQVVKNPPGPAEVKGYPLQCSGLENSMGLQRVGHD